MSKKIKEAIELLGDENVLLADGFEGAFVGIARQFNNPFAIYSRPKCLALLVKQGMSSEDAEEYFSFNVEGAWVGEQTPAFML
jgi:hypothetical protein